ncbi:LmeA family phospholipid-binding protein [Nostocoides sp. HKS02]|uniref:LmeA family phospholipid-binding protein n=1 Tax=Nostocoides sp. HKS02 TaxID=1813880 RepID=UPI001E4A9EF5|nr:LmeA family phospholipid-binding protein [Tetrasphaera sp. HKS02]
MALDGSAVVTTEGGFQDVHATARDVRMTSRGLRVGSLALDATVPFGTVARQVGNGVQLYAAGAGLAGIRRASTALGRTIVIQATGAVTAQGGQLVIEPQTIDLGGPAALNTALSAAARALVTIRHTVQGLPQGMRLTRVTVGADGFRVHLDGTGVALTS